ncbi:MAG TPA: GNAT family N-acetyltransferase [Candidatus Sulfotelmatobacter sp.]|nr:GNAT family N-acetyltransferase [Candidatus Sulfotelmatobacter sp.]
MIEIRPATIADVPLLWTMIRELADFEHELECVSITEEVLARDGFEENPRFRAIIAEWDRHPAGYALFSPYFSTWDGRGMFLEDLFVRKDFRRHGVGRALLAAVARLALEEHCYGIHWQVLDWNTNAVNWYKALGADFRDSWRPVLLTGDSLERLAGSRKV